MFITTCIHQRGGWLEWNSSLYIIWDVEHQYLSLAILKTNQISCSRTWGQVQFPVHSVLGLGISTQYLEGIGQNNPVPSSNKSSLIKQYLHFILFVPRSRKNYFIWFSSQPHNTASVLRFSMTCDCPTVAAGPMQSMVWQSQWCIW